jgi:hypothetical protein
LPIDEITERVSRHAKTAIAGAFVTSKLSEVKNVITSVVRNLDAMPTPQNPVAAHGFEQDQERLTKLALTRWGR